VEEVGAHNSGKIRIRGDSTEMYKSLTGKENEDSSSDLISRHTIANSVHMETSQKQQSNRRHNAFPKRWVSQWKKLPVHLIENKTKDEHK
jgi:hypothetical protein